MVNEIVEFLSRSGWSSQEVAYVRPHLPRWERHLRRAGITVVPSAEAYWSEEEDRSHDHLFHLMMHAGNRTPEWMKHRQRDITGVRRFRPLK
jgi:hypothetical protein